MIISDCETVSIKQQQRQFYNSTKVVLPALFELLYTLFNDRSHYTKALTGSVLIRLAKLSTGPLRVFTPKSILSALRGAIPTLFALGAEAAPVSIYYCRDQVLSVALGHFPEPLAVDVVLRIVFEAYVHSRSSSSSWESLSKSVLPAALGLIEPPSLHYVRTFEDFWRICALFEAISPKALVSEKELLKGKLFVKYKHPEVGEGVLPPPLLPESTFGINHVLKKLKVPWLFHFVVVNKTIAQKHMFHSLF